MQQSVTLDPNSAAVSAVHQDLKPLTSLRFFAALAVLLFHFGSGMIVRLGAPGPLKNAFANGYLGVTFFFVLSGFLLTYSYFDRLSSASDLRKYAVSRLARLYPVYLLGLALLGIDYWPTANIEDALRVISVTQSWTLPLSNLPATWNTPAWTLSIEFSFYIAFPLILMGLRRAKPWHALIGIVFCSAIIAGLGTASVSPGGEAPILQHPWLGRIPFPLIRAPEFILGSWLGLAFVRGWFVLPRFMAPASAFVIIGTMSATHAAWVPAVVCLSAASLILSIAQTARAGTHRLLSSHVLVRLGAASYALYLMQIGVKHGFNAIFIGRWDWIGRLLFPFCLIGLSVLVFVYFEEPCRRLIQQHLSDRKLPAV